MPKIVEIVCGFDCWYVVNKSMLVITRQTRIAKKLWELKNKKRWPSLMHVCHRCDNPPCIRPSHIWPGTQSENVRDSIKKGRWYIGYRNQLSGVRWYEVHGDRDYNGIRNPRAVLNYSRAAEIRRLREEDWTLIDIAEKFGVGVSTIHRVVQGQAWIKS